MSIRVMIVDDQALLRGGFRSLLSTVDDFEVVGEASNGAESVEVAARLKPDVILMDVRMPQMDGLEATRRILKDAAPESTHVLILTTFDLDEYVYEGLRAGASGFVLKDIEPADLIDAVRIVSRGDALLAPSVTRRLITEFANRPSASRAVPAAISELTEREREVLVQIAHGLSNDEIADALVIAPATAKTHVSRIMSKLDARDRAQLVVIAFECGLVTPGGG